MTNDYEGGDSATFKTASVMGWASETEIILLVFYIVTVLELWRRFLKWSWPLFLILAFPPTCLQVNDLFEIVILPGSGWAMLFQSPWLHSNVPLLLRMLDWLLRNGIGDIRGDVSGQHVCQGLLGERDPETDHKSARRGRRILRDQNRVVRQKRFVFAQELFRFWEIVQKTGWIIPWGQKSSLQVAAYRRLV